MNSWKFHEQKSSMYSIIWLIDTEWFIEIDTFTTSDIHVQHLLTFVNLFCAIITQSQVIHHCYNCYFVDSNLKCSVYFILCIVTAQLIKLCITA